MTGRLLSPRGSVGDTSRISYKFPNKELLDQNDSSKFKTSFYPAITSKPINSNGIGVESQFRRTKCETINNLFETKVSK